MPRSLSRVVQLEATESAFAALLADGEVVCWGSIEPSLEASGAGLFDVQKLYASSKAFAALKRDGTVACWGPMTSGGGISRVQERLLEVKEIYAGRNGFIAERRDGKAVLWGEFELQEDDPVLETITEIQDTIVRFCLVIVFKGFCLQQFFFLRTVGTSSLAPQCLCLFVSLFVCLFVWLLACLLACLCCEIDTDMTCQGL